VGGVEYFHFSKFQGFIFFSPYCFSSSILPDAVAGVVHNVPALDSRWIEATEKKAAYKLEKLDTDLKNYRSNSIKESIRYGTFSQNKLD
jgi:hypothetical protein